jgi:hypothetical protein
MKDMDDIFKRLNSQLLPSYEMLQELQRTLGKRIQLSIIEDMMNARTVSELEQIRDANEFWFNEWSELSLHYDKALNRIKNVFKVYRDLMGLEMMN